MPIDTVEDGPPLGRLDSHLEPFLTHLRAVGYAEGTLRRKRSIVAAFARWTRREQIALEALNESHIAAFIERLPRTGKTRLRLARAALRPLLQHVRREAPAAISSRPIAASPAGDLAQRYLAYLRTDRGLTENSVRVYVPFIRDLLTDRVGKDGGLSPNAFDALTIQTFLLNRTRNRSREYARLLATALRSSCRFLFLRGETPRDLSLSVPPVRRWRPSTPHVFLSPAEVQRVLSATDRSTSHGRRDHAILLLLARLGLRAGEVVALELGDIRWQSGQIVVRGKGRVREPLPLLSDIGEALALYLYQDRRGGPSRRVFVRLIAPRVGLAGPCAVDHIVRRALARAGLRRVGRSLAHLFRHSLATRMIRQGASLAEIAEVLRHRSQRTTAIYAQVSFEALRGVARPWPATGGAQ